MWRPVVLATALVAGVAIAAETPSLLQRGEAEYHAGHYAAAADLLRNAFTATLTPEAQKQYVEDSRFDALPQVEESLVYLALSYAKLGRDTEARDTILRLMTAERIAPSYADLPLQRDRAEFETIAHRLVAGFDLPRGAKTAQVAVANDAAERAVMLRLIDERAAAQRAEIEQKASAKAAPAPAPVAVVAPPPAALHGDPLRARYDEMARTFAASTTGKETVQLEIACETASVTAAMRSAGNEIWFVPIAYRGRPCYRVFFGHYATAAAAQQASSRIPAPLGPGVVLREPAPVR